jgi:hypothetical protein
MMMKIVEIYYIDVRYYKPCRVEDYNYDVKSDGWVILEE